ncbi:MAG: response regulator transcription factor [Bryobacterales bacterium]|nr:response regulator transcription factor [Bryobacterales bacterium]MBV9398988.1 response regulator transcription factor [Bryobacterales bacterium]
MQRIRLLLLDDHILFREGLRRLLVSEPDFETVAECGTPAEALDALARSPVDVVLLDFDLEDDTGTRFIASAIAAGYKGKILMVTAGMSALDISVAKKLGISGIFLKHNPPSRLLEAIRAVSAGGAWMDPKITPAGNSSGAETSVSPDRLTPREQKVLRCVFEGLSNKEMAYQLGVSQSSVKATLQHLFDKMGVRTRGQLVRIAIERSLETARES